MAVTGERLCPVMARMANFLPFRTENPTDRTAVCRCSESPENPPAWERVLYHLTDEDATYDFGLIACGYRLCTQLDNGDCLELWTESDGAARLHGDLTPRLLRFALWTAYGLATVHRQTVLVHTSCIVCHDEAILFLGESGTGKSTHTRLWREHIAGSHLLNDDSPVVRIEEDGIWVYGSPWSGKTPCYRTERYPMKACVRLSQAPQNEMRRLRPLQAFAALHPSCPPAFAYVPSLYDGVSCVLDRLLTTVPCYHLACLPDSEATQLSYRTIFNVE